MGQHNKTEGITFRAALIHMLWSARFYVRVYTTFFHAASVLKQAPTVHFYVEKILSYEGKGRLTL